MKNFIRNNLVLVAGVALPVLLVVGFFLLAKVPQKLIDQPNYDFILVGYHYDHSQRRDYYLNFEVKDSRLIVRATPGNDIPSHHNRQHAKLFRYVAADNRFEEIIFDLPEELDDLKEKITFQPKEIEDLRLDKKPESADGFTFQHVRYRGRGGLLGEMFGMGRRYDNNFTLVKDGVEVDLPHPGTNPNMYYYGNNLIFLGWVIPEGGSR